MSAARCLEAEAVPCAVADALPAPGLGAHEPAGLACLQISGGLLAAGILIALMPIPFVFAHGPAWAAQRLLPPIREAGWAILGGHAACLALCRSFARLRSPIGVLTYRLSYVYGGIAWLSGLVMTYLLWGVGAVMAGIVCVGGGLVTTGLLATLIRGEWQRFMPMLLFVVLAVCARRGGMRLAHHGMRYPR